MCDLQLEGGVWGYHKGYLFQNQDFFCMCKSFVWTFCSILNISKSNSWPWSWPSGERIRLLSRRSAVQIPASHLWEGDWLLCWLYTPANMSHQRWISGNVYHVCLCKVRIRQNPLWLWNPEEMPPEVQNRGISDPTNGHISNKKFLKKQKKKLFILKLLIWEERL